MKCNHCGKEGLTGTHGGCLDCGKVKWHPDGKKHHTVKDGRCIFCAFKA